jgi:periplasmic protein TonB
MARMPRLSIDRRFLSAAFSAAIHAAALGLLLLWHFSPAPRDDRAAMTVIELPDRPPPEKPPPPPPQPQPTPGAARSREAAPPAPRAEAAPLAAAVVPLVIPSFAPAPVPATGTQPNSGAALSGTGTGAGGAGNGTGGGGNGGGGGAGQAQGEGTEPVITRGDFKPSDYPKALRETRPRGRTWTEVMVAVNGRPISCRVTRSSGTALLDSETCRIIMQRFRFRPGRDAARKPIVAPFEIDIGWEFLDLNPE